MLIVVLKCLPCKILNLTQLIVNRELVDRLHIMTFVLGTNCDQHLQETCKKRGTQTDGQTEKKQTLLKKNFFFSNFLQMAEETTICDAASDLESKIQLLPILEGFSYCILEIAPNRTHIRTQSGTISTSSSCQRVLDIFERFDLDAHVHRRKITPGMKRKRFDQLQTKEITKQEYCCICMNSQDDQKFVVMSCNHSGHVECMWKWLQGHNTCPVCRAIL